MSGSTPTGGSRASTASPDTVGRFDVVTRRRRKSGASKDKHGSLLRELPVLIVVALGLALLIKAFLVQAFYIPSGSMEPGLQINDRIMVEKPSYWFGHPQRGDIVVFGDPAHWLDESEDAGPTGAVSKVLEKIGLSLEEIRAELAKLPHNRVPERSDWAKLSASWTKRPE